MDLRVCEYCGMEYSADASVCPICGRPATPGAAVHPAETVVDTGARTAPKKGGKFAAKKGSGGKKAAPVQKPAEPGGNIYAIPKWMMAAICVILGLAVAAGAVFALYQIGYLDQSFVSLYFQDESTAPIPKETE